MLMLRPIRYSHVKLHSGTQIVHFTLCLCPCTVIVICFHSPIILSLFSSLDSSQIAERNNLILNCRTKTMVSYNSYIISDHIIST